MTNIILRVPYLTIFCAIKQPKNPILTTKALALRALGLRTILRSSQSKRSLKVVAVLDLLLDLVKPETLNLNPHTALPIGPKVVPFGVHI